MVWSVLPSDSVEKYGSLCFFRDAPKPWLSGVSAVKDKNERALKPSQWVLLPTSHYGFFVGRDVTSRRLSRY